MSYWNNNYKKDYKLDRLSKNISTDICIIGAGLCGLTTGYYLTKAGRKVTIIEQNRVCSRTSGCTTGKITSQHGLFYDYLIKSYGVQFARDYLEINQDAIKNIIQIVQDENIKCDLVRSSSYVFCDKKSDLPLFNQEISSLNRIKADVNNANNYQDAKKSKGIVFDAKLVKKLDIPIKNYGGIEFKNQAMFNPRKYAFGLVECILKNHGAIYENTKATNIKFEDGIYKVTANGKTIRANKIVLATHFPIKNFPGMYFLKMYQDISYVLAIKTPNKAFDGYYVNSGSPAISFRNVFEKDGENIVLISGNGHKVGRINNNKDSYKFLEDIAHQMFDSYEILDKWSTQDCISLDKLPYIGNFSKILPDIYVATGFKKWGMTLSNVAGKIISNKILGVDNKYEYLFAPARIQIIKNSKAFGEQVKETFYSIGLNKLKLPNETLKDVKNDSGKIVLFNGKKVGVYKDKNGNCFLVKPICTHLKCELQFNPTDKTWDCPCHGSRFSYTGEVINNPAIFNLDKL